jgi:uncharacterized protein (DUF302 family)
METTSYAFKTRVAGRFDETVQRVEAELKKEGFGVLTVIDVRETLKRKLDVDFRPYTILGACNPQNAFAALSVETDIGLMLPCNVIVYGGDDGGTVVAAIDPVASMQAVGNPALAVSAGEVRSRLQRVVRALG